MSTKNKIAAMTAAQFGQFTRDHKASLIAFSAAALFAIGECSNGKTNTSPLNEMMRLPTVQCKNHKLLQFGTALRGYFVSLLGGSVQWQADKGRFQFVSKHETVYVDISACQRFAEYFADKMNKTAKEADEKAPQPVSASTLDKAIRKASENGLTAKDVKTAQSLLESVALLQTAALALVQSMQEKKDENAATVTDGATGEHSRREAHGGPEAAIAKTPAKVKTTKRGNVGDALAAAMQTAWENGHGKTQKAA